MPRTEHDLRNEFIDEYLKLHERSPGTAVHWLLGVVFGRLTATERTLLLDELEERIDLLERERG